MTEIKKTSTKKNMVRRLLWKESLQAVKISSCHQTFESFREALQNSLHYNSSYIRKRNTSSIIRWFFPQRSLNNILTRTWASYNDEQITQELMRYQYLTIEPDVAEFVLEHILGATPGSQLNLDFFNDFILKKYGVVRVDPLNSLRGAVKNMGFLIGEGKYLSIKKIPIPKTSFLILTHCLFAETPQTITLKEIVANPFWKLLGIADTSIVRQILHQADSEGAISKYIIADQLEQITTRYSLDEFIGRQTKL